MPCDRRHSPTVRSCQELARIGRKHNRSCQCLSSSRYVDGIKVLAEQFNQSVLAMVRKAAERVSPAETLGNRRRRRRATPTPRRSATWAKVGEGHAVTGGGTGIVAFSTYFPRRMHSLPKYRI